MNTVILRLCGSVVFVDCCQTKDAEALRSYLAPALIDGSSDLLPIARARVSELSVEILRGPAVERRRDLSPFLELELVFMRWATALRPSVALHTGCVVFRGVPILFVAPSGSGKSTMTLAAVRAQSDYVTDDLLTLSQGCGYGFARAIRFKSVSAEEDAHASYLKEMDLKSFIVTIHGERRIVPLYAGKMQTRHHLDFTEHPPAVVVRVAQGEEAKLSPLSSLDRAIILHEAAITEHEEYDGSLGPGPTFDLVWRDPNESFEMLAEAIRDLNHPAT